MIARKAASTKATNRASGLSVPAEVKAPIFKGQADLMRAAYKAHRGDRTSQNRLHAYTEEVSRKAPLGMNEGTTTQGGYAVIPEWYETIWDKVREYPKLLDMTDKRAISSSTLNIPAINETSLADGSRHGGIQAYWVSEGSAITSSYPALTQVQAIKQTQAALLYISNQLLEDNSFDLDSYVGKKVGLEFAFQHNVSVVNGSGSAQPTGILNQAALITVAKESGQANATVVFPNLAKMMGRLWPASRSNCVFLANPEVYQQLVTMTFPNAAGSYPAFGGISFNAHEEFPLRVFGRPVIEVLNCPQLGLPGDIILADLSQLVTIETPGMEVAVSTEIQFTTLQTAYRFVRRYDIKSPWTSALTPYDGSANTFSPFVVLASRGT